MVKLMHNAYRLYRVKYVYSMHENVLNRILDIMKLKPIHPEFFEIEMYIENFYNRYPMVKNIGLTYIDEQTKQNVSIYIKLMDEYYDKLKATEFLTGI